MTARSSAARRLSLCGCLLLGAAAPALLPGCGNDGAANAESAVATQPGQQRPAPGRGEPCPRQVGALLESLDALRGKLAAGLSYKQYAARVGGLRSAYEEIPVDRLAIDCLAIAGTPGERTLNEYIEAANAWGACLASASCTSTAIEPVLQRHWQAASRALSEARRRAGD